jgi:hypothetical protein
MAGRDNKGQYSQWLYGHIQRTMEKAIDKCFTERNSLETKQIGGVRYY